MRPHGWATMLSPFFLEGAGIRLEPLGLAHIDGLAEAAAVRAVLRDGARHPSPNAGWCEAAFAGALGLRLGGTYVYGGVAEVRPGLGEGRTPEPDDIRRAVRLSRAVTAAATGLAVLIAVTRDA